MERFKLDAWRAFAMLTKLSQDSNIPLRQIAEKARPILSPRHLPRHGASVRGYEKFEWGIPAGSGFPTEGIYDRAAFAA